MFYFIEFKKLEFFLHFPAIFFSEIRSHWPEFALYKELKQFTLLAFSCSFAESDANRLTTIAHSFIHKCKLFNPNFKVICKVHQLTHYGELIKKFGPAFLYTNFRYERVHKFAKNVTLMQNFKFPSHTIHRKQQMRKAICEQQNRFLKVNFWSKPPQQRPYLLDQLPIGAMELKGKNRPFVLNGQILRAIRGSRRQWLLPCKFFHLGNKIYCQGKIATLFYNSTAASGRSKVPSRHPHTDLQQLSISRSQKFISFESLHHANSFYFHSDNSYYLLDWLFQYNFY